MIDGLDARDRRLDRRDFLRLAAVAGPLVALAASGCNDRRVHRTFGAAMRLNDWVGEHVFLAGGRLARDYPTAARTPESRFPAYHVSRAVPVLDASERWSLAVDGLVRRPTRFTRTMLEALPTVRYTAKHHCVEGWTAIGTWAGPTLATIASLVEPTGEARYVRFESFDSGYSNGWDMKSAMHPQTILAHAYNDRPLEPAHGAPVRLYSPIKLGYKMTKYLTRVTFTRERPGGYWEDRGYPWFAGV